MVNPNTTLECMCGNKLNYCSEFKLERLGNDKFRIVCSNKLCQLKEIGIVNLKRSPIKLRINYSVAFKEWNEVLLGSTRAREALEEFKVKIASCMGIKVGFFERLIIKFKQLIL